MGLVNQTIPGLYNGVSQQPHELRLDTQVTEMVNCYPSLVQGAHKRNPTVLHQTDNSVPTDAFIHVYDRGADSEQYIIVIKATPGTSGTGQYKVYEGDGTLVQDWETAAYLDLPSETYTGSGVTPSPKTAFKALTVGDTTYIINKTVDVAMLAATDDNGDSDWESQFFYWVKRTTEIRYGTNGADSKGYSYYIYNDSSTTAIAEAEGSDGVEVATALAALLDSATAKGSVVKAAVASGTYKGADSWGDQATESWQGSIRKLQDLPSDLGYEGTVIEITGDDKNSFDNFYVKFVDGVYKETFRPGLANTLDVTTMPHALTRESLTEFAFSGVDGQADLDWGARKYGDEDSAPVPSFVGKPLEDIFFFKNRLGMLAGDNIIMSETGEYYNFWPTTITDVLDSDPIDVAVDSNRAVHLRYAIPYNKELLVFGDRAQFILSASKALTPKDLNVQQSTAYDINRNVEPITLGPNVYFVTNKDESSIVREYFTVPDTATNDAANITAHCPYYVPKDLVKLMGSSKHDMIFAITGTDNNIYVYNYYWQGTEKAQSAWHRWEVAEDETIFNIEVLNNQLLVMVRYDDDTTHLESISLELPKNISSVGDYTDDDGADVVSRIELSKWGVPEGNSEVDSNRASLRLRDLKFNMGEGSKYGVEVSRGVVSNTWYNYDSNGDPIGDHKYTVVGNADTVNIAFVSETNKGFKLDSLSWRGNMHLRGSQGI